jgi:ribonuclease HI
MALMTEIVAVYADGGVIHRNPSPMGGTWAACHVDAQGNRVWEASGVTLPHEVPKRSDYPRPMVTNNQTEFYAVLAGLEALPEGWHGQVCSDSNVTRLRFFFHARLAGIPEEWERRMWQAQARLDWSRCQPVLLAGHPTKAQLLAGIGRHGFPVSGHNVWCDAECGRIAKKLINSMQMVHDLIEQFS